MTPERVTQQERLYAAERSVIPTIVERWAKRFDSQEEIQRYLVDKLLDQPWWEERFPKVHTILCPTVKRRAGTGSVGGLTDADEHIGIIEMAQVHWNEMYVLHEVAHVTAESEGESHSHDPLFARTYLELVYRMIGHGAWALLRKAFIEHHICIDERCQELPECQCS
jgi:putative metallohydrolase (TIGR04338 family)